MSGVSNYGVAHLKELLASNPRIKPAVNQVEVHEPSATLGIKTLLVAMYTECTF